MPVPADPKIYHIVHVDRLPSIIPENDLLLKSRKSGITDEEGERP